MTQKAPDQTNLQQDDPSIIQCTVKDQSSKTRSSAITSKNEKTASKPVKKETRPKFVPGSKTQSEKKSDPVNIKPNKNWQARFSNHSGANAYNKGHYPDTGTYSQHNEYHHKGGYYRPSSSHPPRISSSPTKSTTSNNNKKTATQISEKRVATATSANIIRKTGTPIDNLMSARLAPTFNVSKPIDPPKSLQQLFPKKEQATSYDKPKDNALQDPSKISNAFVNKTRIKSFPNEKHSTFNKDQSSLQSNEKAKEPKRKRNRGRRNNKPKQSPPTENSDVKTVLTGVNVTNKPASVRENIDAGKKILNMVNGGPKAFSGSAPKVSEASSQTVEKQDKASSTLSPVEKNTSRLLSASSAKKDDSQKEGKAVVQENVSSSSKVSERTENKQKPPSKVAVRNTKTLAENANSKTQKALGVDKQEAERMERLALEQAAQRFRKDYLILLQKAPQQHPHAKFFCKVCIYHMDSIPIAQRHIREKRHKKNVKEQQQDEFLRNLKMPPEDALEEIDNLLLNKVLDGKILDGDDLELRKSVVQALDDLVRQEVPNCKVVLYGSSLTGFGFKNSDVNVDLQFPEEMRAPTVLLQVLNVIKKSDLYVDVQAEFHAKFPRIDFTHEKTGLHLQLSTGNELAVFTSRLLRFYAILDKRLVQLAMVHRTWARMCQLDLQHDGGLPPHSLPIMAIFFMQRKNFVPVLHEKISEWDMDRIIESNLKCPQLKGQGSDWWYHPTPPPVRETPSDQTQSTEDTDSDNDSDVNFEFQEITVDFSHLSDHNIDNLVITKPGETSEEHLDSDTFSKPVLLRDNCVGSQVSLAFLWLNMLRFYALQYPLESEIITILTSEHLTREDKKWHKKRIGMMDPYLIKRNLCRSLNTQGVFTYFLNRLKAALLYFFKPQIRWTTNNVRTVENRKKGPKQAKQADKPNEIMEFAETLSATVIKNALPHLKTETQALNYPNELIHLADELLEKVMVDVAKISLKDNNDDSTQVDGETSISEPNGEKDSKPSETPASTGASSSEQNETNNEPSIPGNKSKYSYAFSMTVITNNKFPVKVCGLCKREGHARKSCPEDVKLQELSPLPPLSNELKGMLDRVCYRMFDMYALTPQETKYRDNICESLTLYLQQKYKYATRMNLFGSSRNGFGFRGSDLDICMTFEGHKTAENFDPVQVIEEVAKQLRKNKEFWNILPITTAKVPIVKFYHQESRLEGDISLYNLLAQRNTLMLKCYSLIDARCKVLGYVIKAFVKRCSIGDASRGSLSSYAYTLMVIYYLQQKEVPVLPVLQELDAKDAAKPLEIVDGWDSWFYDDLLKLPQVWDGYNKNKESVGELWLGLLRFYTEEFNFRRQVVSIRQKKIITTFEKEWTSKFISIEDPFDLNHNLAAGVSHKMATFINLVFIQARLHFGNIPTVELRRMDECLYFFDEHVLMDGQEAPNDRCCRICGKIGHYLRDCPKNRRNKPKDGKDGANVPERSLIKCFYCGKEGHMKRDCPELKQLEEEEDDEDASTKDQPASPQRTQQSNSNTSNAASSVPQPSQSIATSLPISTSSDSKKPPLSVQSLIASEQLAKSTFPRSLPTDLKLLVDSSKSNQSKRLYQRVSESASSSKVDEKAQSPKPSQGPVSISSTPPASFKLHPTFPSPISRPLAPLFPAAFFASDAIRGNTDVVRSLIPSSSSASNLSPARPPASVPPPPLHGPPTWPNSPIWNFPPRTPLSPSQQQPNPIRFDSKLQEGNSPRMTSPSRGFPMSPPPPVGFPTMSPPRGLPSPTHGLPSPPRSLPPGLSHEQLAVFGVPRPNLPLPNLLPGFRLPQSGMYPVYTQPPTYPTSDRSSTSSEMTSPSRHQAPNLNVPIGQSQNKKS